LTRDRRPHASCHTYNPRNRTEEGPTVNPTARWPERLDYLATLLRADAVAVVSASAEGPTAIFTHRIDRPVDWLAALGTDLFERAARGPFATPVPAGRWRDGASYAVVAPLGSWNGGAVLCGLREEVPFDAVDTASAAAGARLLEISALEGRAIAETMRETDTLAERLEDIARRVGAGAASIMVVEGDLLRLRAAIGLSDEVSVGQKQRVGEGIAGWVAARGEKVVLWGPVEETRFTGTDPGARESVSVPLREGADVLGVLSVKRPEADRGFADRHEVIDAMAADLAREIRSMNTIAGLQRERGAVRGELRVAHAVAARDIDGALRAALDLGHHAVAVRDGTGRVVGTAAVDGDEGCRESAITMSGRAREAAPGRPSVGFARHGEAYAEGEGEAAQRTADTLALLGRGYATEEAAALRILAVEDHPVMRLGVRTLLEREGFVVAGTTATCAEALGLLSDARADVVLLDLHLPDVSGAEGVERLREAAPALPIVVYSVERTPALIRAVLRAGANGYVTKDAPTARLVAALHAASAGLVVMGPEEAIAAAGAATLEQPNGEQRAPESNGDTEHEPTVPREPLTPRELELLRYMAEGYTNKEVARAMVLAEDTVKKAVQTLIAKLGAADRTHAVVLALRNHLID
jgi:DNA-binding NarL/FixJ family response regulator